MVWSFGIFANWKTSGRFLLMVQRHQQAVVCLFSLHSKWFCCSKDAIGNWKLSLTEFPDYCEYVIIFSLAALVFVCLQLSLLFLQGYFWHCILYLLIYLYLFSWYYTSLFLVWRELVWLCSWVWPKWKLPCTSGFWHKVIIKIFQFYPKHIYVHIPFLLKLNKIRLCYWLLKFSF